MKLKYVYHGSTTSGIKELEPRKRYTPGILGKEAKPAIYAAADPAYAAGHAFPWKSSEGFDIFEKDNRVILIVPKKFKKRLDQQIYIYKLPIKNFKLLKPDTPKALIYISYKKVEPVEVKAFKNIIEALKFYGGEVEYIYP